MKKKWFLPLSVFLLLALFSPFLKERLVLNLDALDTLHTLYTGQALFSGRPTWMTESQVCAAHWLAGLRAEAQGALEARDQAYRLAVACDPRYVSFLHRKYPEDLSMSQMALTHQPGSAQSWFWAGDLLPEQKVAYYRQGLVLDSSDGRRWITLGDLLNQSDPQAAMQAYLQGCQNGDPGFNACGRAASVAERLGLYAEAIEYYRLSSYKPFREKADILEATLTPRP